MRKVALTYFLIGVAAFSSCSVKEDRTSCPCIVTLDASAFEGDYQRAYSQLITQTQDLRDTLDLSMGETSCEWLAQKGVMTSYVYAGLVESTEHEGIVSIPLGHQADPLRGYCRRFECYEEELTVVAKVNRQGALVNFEIKDVEDGMYQYNLEVVSDVSGIDLRTMYPVKGEFRCSLPLDGNARGSFLMPRQLPESKPFINVYLQDTLIDTLPLHEWIQAVGYDWTQEDLPDINISVDQGQLQVHVSVEGWSGDNVYEVIF